MATSSHDVTAFIKTRSELARPDAQLIMAPFSLVIGPEAKFEFESNHGMVFFGYQMRPESRGHIMIRSADPAEQPEIQPNYFTAEKDCRTVIDTVRYIRRFSEQPAFQECIAEETYPGLQVNSDDEILDMAKRTGKSVFHASGTCKMGLDKLSVVDPQLRVRGVSGLRVVDASVMPSLVSGNTNAAAMAIGWRGSDLILRDAG